MKEQNVPGVDRASHGYAGKESSGRRHARLSFLIALLALAAIMLAMPAAAPAQVSFGASVTIGPPPLPVYVQPLCPGPDFIWIPGYWAWDPDFGYYWVPGLWVEAPFVGAFWTPGYWAWSDGVYVWNEGYWGPVVGFYGGINYGFGYTGFGYAGGYWSGNSFYYNRTVNNVNVTNITNVYTKKVVTVQPAGASFNGGPGGTPARPTSKQLESARERRLSLTSEQERQMQTARSDPRQRMSINHGRPAVAATVKPGVFTGRGVTGTGRQKAFSRPPEGRRTGPSGHVRKQQQGPQPYPYPRGTEPERMMPGPRGRPEGPVYGPGQGPQGPQGPKQPEQRRRGEEQEGPNR